jgi:hypothetical protein
MALLLVDDCAVLASAYQLERAQVQEDAARVQQWGGPEADLVIVFEERHGWTVVSEYGPYYLAALRRALRRTPEHN